MSKVEPPVKTAFEFGGTFAGCYSF